MKGGDQLEGEDRLVGRDGNGNLIGRLKPCHVLVEPLDLAAVEAQGVRLELLNRSESSRSFSSCISLM